MSTFRTYAFLVLSVAACSSNEPASIISSPDSTPTTTPPTTPAPTSTPTTTPSAAPSDTLPTTTVQSKVAAPTFSPSTALLGPETTITIADTTPNATIYYTTDNTTPTTASTKYVGPFALGCGGQLPRAIAVLDGWLPSDVATMPSLPISTTSLVSFTPAAGEYANPVQVTLAYAGSALVSSEIHYTLDGSQPTSTSPLYAGPLTIDHTVTIKAIDTNGVDACGPVQNSEVTEATYTIDN